MKKLLLISILFMALKVMAFPDYFDITTRSTNPISSGGGLAQLNMTNITVLTNASGQIVSFSALYSMTNPTGLFIGDTFPVGLAKLNGDILYLATAVRTNGSTANGQVFIISNTIAAGGAWVSFSGGSGGTASNLTPWITDINAANFQLTNISHIGSSGATVDSTSSGSGSGILWGYLNRILGANGVVLVGGLSLYDNGGYNDFGAGGFTNIMSEAGRNRFIGGGESNLIYYSRNSSILGGWSNTVNIANNASILNGVAATAKHDGVTIIADNRPEHYIESLAPDTVIIRATNGLAINTNDARSFALSTPGAINAGNYYKNGVIFTGGGITGGDSLNLTNTQLHSTTYFADPAGALIPNMTASNLPSGNVSASSVDSGHNYDAFTNGTWNSGAEVAPYIQYQFASPVLAFGVVMTVSGVSTNILQISNDGILYRTVYIQNSLINGVPFPITPTYATYFRWYFPSDTPSPHQVNVGGINLFGAPVNTVIANGALQIIGSYGTYISRTLTNNNPNADSSLFVNGIARVNGLLDATNYSLNGVQGFTTNITGTFNGGTHTASFTNGLLMNFQ